jgi:hypothetical protein
MASLTFCLTASNATTLEKEMQTCASAGVCGPALGRFYVCIGSQVKKQRERFFRPLASISARLFKHVLLLLHWGSRKESKSRPPQANFFVHSTRTYMNGLKKNKCEPISSRETRFWAFDIDFIFSELPGCDGQKS